MMKLSEVRKLYPQYSNMSDYELTSAMHRKYAPNASFEQYASEFGGPTQEDSRITQAREYNQNHPDAPINPEEIGQGSFLSDTGHMVAAGINGLAGDVLWGAEKAAGFVGADNVANALGSASDYFDKSAEAKRNAVSADMKLAQDKTFLAKEGENGILGDAWTDPRAYAGTIAESLPSMGLGMGGASAIAKGLMSSKGISSALAYAIGSALGEGSISGVSAAHGVHDAIMEMPEDKLLTSPEYNVLRNEGMGHDDAKQSLANSVSGYAGVTAGGATALLGVPMGNLYGRAVGGEVGERLAGTMVKQAGGEWLEESGQSGAEQITQNVAMQRVDPSLPTMQGVGEATVQGGMAGLTMGGGMGPVAHYRGKAAKRQQEQVEQEAKDKQKQAEEARLAEEQARLAEEQRKEEIERRNEGQDVNLGYADMEPYTAMEPYQDSIINDTEYTEGAFLKDDKAGYGEGFLNMDSPTYLGGATSPNENFTVTQPADTFDSKIIPNPAGRFGYGNDKYFSHFEANSIRDEASDLVKNKGSVDLLAATRQQESVTGIASGLDGAAFDGGFASPSWMSPRPNRNELSQAGAFSVYAQGIEEGENQNDPPTQGLETEWNERANAMGRQDLVGDTRYPAHQPMNFGPSLDDQWNASARVGNTPHLADSGAPVNLDAEWQAMAQQQGMPDLAMGIGGIPSTPPATQRGFVNTPTPTQGQITNIQQAPRADTMAQANNLGLPSPNVTPSPQQAVPQVPSFTSAPSQGVRPIATPVANMPSPQVSASGGMVSPSMATPSVAPIASDGASSHVDAPVYQYAQAADSPEAPRISKIAYGRDGNIKLPKGGNVPFRYALMEDTEVQSSHLPDRGFQKNEQYELENERRYHDEPASQEKVVTNAATLDHDFLLSSPDANHGAPVVDSRGNVIGGNGRAMSLSLAYGQSKERTKGYRRALEEDAQSFGFSHNDLRKFKKPVLVRMLDDKLSQDEKQALVTSMNDDFKHGKDRRASGKSRGDRFSEKTLKTLAADMQDSESLREFFSSPESLTTVENMFADGVLLDTDRNALLGSDGLLNPDGKRIVEEALRGRVSSSYEVLAKLSPAVLGKVDGIIPHVLRTENVGGPWDISHDVRDAVDLVVEFEGSGSKNFSAFADTGNMLHDDKTPRERYSPEAVLIADKLLNDKKADVVKSFSQYAFNSSLSGNANALPGVGKSRYEAFSESFGELPEDTQEIVDKDRLPSQGEKKEQSNVHNERVHHERSDETVEGELSRRVREEHGERNPEGSGGTSRSDADGNRLRDDGGDEPRGSLAESKTAVRDKKATDLELEQTKSFREKLAILDRRQKEKEKWWKLYDEAKTGPEQRAIEKAMYEDLLAKATQSGDENSIKSYQKSLDKLAKRQGLLDAEKEYFDAFGEYVNYVDEMVSKGVPYSDILSKEEFSPKLSGTYPTSSDYSDDVETNSSNTVNSLSNLVLSVPDLNPAEGTGSTAKSSKTEASTAHEGDASSVEIGSKKENKSSELKDSAPQEAAEKKTEPVEQVKEDTQDEPDVDESLVTPENFAITEDVAIGEGTDGQKIQNNIAAIKIIKALQKEGRKATPSEQASLAKYVGWGGLKTVFDVKKADSNDMYGRAQRELKEILSASEYAAAKRSIQDAHYTARGVVEAMWRMARHLGFKGGRVLEPTVGVGNFIGLQPQDMANNSEWHASELDAITGAIAKALYPNANILAATGFQDAQFANGVFDLAIGNPPFGSATITDKQRPDISGMKIHNYIISKAGTHLREGGVMAMVVTHRFLDTANPEARNTLAKDFNFIGAFRLPNDAFAKSAGTEVVTDVIFLQKKREGDKQGSLAWLDTEGHIQSAEDGDIRVNRYYQENPTHILGRSAMDGTMYAGKGNEYTVHGDGRDLGKAIDKLIEGPFANLAGIMERTDKDNDVVPVMLAQSTLAIGDMRLAQDGTIERREMDDEQGAVISQITPETPWGDDASGWSEVREAAEELRDALKNGTTDKLPKDFRGRFNVAYTASQKKKSSPTKLESAVYQLVDDFFIMDTIRSYRPSWTHDNIIATLKAAESRRLLGQSRYDRLKGLLGLRNKTQELILAEKSNAKNMEQLRKELNAMYDAFVAKYGFVSDPKNLSILGGDIKAEAGLEASYEKEVTLAMAKKSGGKAQSAKASKADILTQRVNFPYKPISHVSSSTDALVASLSERGAVDIEYMAQITGKDTDTVIKELNKGEHPQIFLNPETGLYEDADSYLSGNVREKLRTARQSGNEINAKALEAVQPTPRTKEQISPDIRGSWMPESVYRHFLEALGCKGMRLSVIPSIGRVSAEGSSNVALSDFGLQFKDDTVDVYRIFNAATSGKSINIYVEGPNGKKVKDDNATRKANALVERMAKVFKAWAFSDEVRTDMIVDAYNETMNTHVKRKYDGEKYLTTVGANPSIKLRRIQKNAAWRMLQSKNVLLDIVVGGGKSFTFITGAKERKRIGLSKKPLIVVPNHIVGQIAQDFYRIYPDANVLAASPADFTKKNRRKLFARMATGDYDAIIIGHSSLSFIETPVGDVREVLEAKKSQLALALDEARANKESKRTLAQMEKRIESYDAKLKKLLDHKKDAMSIDLEDMGVDYIIVDEAHEFKNLEYATAGERVVGMNDPNGSKKAFDLFTKLRGIIKRGGGVTFATGTPISNSLVEIYTVMQYLAYEDLEARGQLNFDAWAGAYAATETRLEYTATQKLKPRRVLSSLNNLHALRQIYENFADIVTMDDLKQIYAEETRESNKKHGTNKREEFPVPKVSGGGRVLNSGPITEAQSEYMDYLVSRMNAIEEHKGSKEYASIDNPLWVMSDARKMSLDIRIVDPSKARDENGKVARAAKNIKSIYDKTSAHKGTQLVFCDLSTPSKNAVTDARRTIKKTAELVLGKSEAKTFLGLNTDETYAEQWETLKAKAEEIGTADPEKLEAFEKHFSSPECVDAESDMVTADTGFSVYDDLRTVLVDSGIPENEIAFIHDYDSQDKKNELFANVNNGAVRVLIGSSAKMGAGTNAQKRLVALHHMDAPWRPSDVEQREGRIIRQGNVLFEEDPDKFQVEIVAYSTEGTSDTVMWQILERKARGIELFRKGNTDSIEEEGSDSNQYADFMASSTGNPVFKWKLEAERHLQEVEAENNGLLMAKANAVRFMGGYAKAKKDVEGDIAALKGLKVDRVTFGEAKGSMDDFDKAMENAQAKYQKEYAAWSKENDEAGRAYMEWLATPVGKRGAKPKKPEMPKKPTILHSDVLAKSAYARIINDALDKSASNKKVTISFGDFDVNINPRAQAGDKHYLWAVEIAVGDRVYTVDFTTAKAAKSAPRIVNALNPHAIATILNDERRASDMRLKRLERQHELANKHKDIVVDTSKQDTARDEVKWLGLQVSLAEKRADIARSGAPVNSYVMSDKGRELSTTYAEMGEAQSFVVDGKKVKTTGVQVGDYIDAFIVSSGEKVIIQESSDAKGEKSRKLIYEPSSMKGKEGSPYASLASHLPPDTAKNRGLDHKKVKVLVEGLSARASKATKTEVVQSFEDLPEEIRRYYVGKNTSSIEGMYDPASRTVWLVADNISSLDRAGEVWMHEQIVHNGLRSMMAPSERKRVLAQLFAELGGVRHKGLQAIATKYGLKPLESYEDRQLVMEEYLASLAEARGQNKMNASEKSAWKKFVDAVLKAWHRVLARVGVKSSIGAVHVDALLCSLERFVMDGKPADLVAPYRAPNAYMSPAMASVTLEQGSVEERLLASLSKGKIMTMSTRLMGELAEYIGIDPTLKMNFKDGDLRLIQRIFSLPHWIAKKHKAFAALYERQLRRMDERAQALKTSLETVPSLFGKDRLGEKDMDSLRKILWDTEGKADEALRDVTKFNETKDEKGRVFISVEPSFYTTYSRWVDGLDATDAAKKALIEIRKSLDNDLVVAHNRMASMGGVHKNIIDKFRGDIGRVPNYFPHHRYGNYYVRATVNGKVVYREHFDAKTDTLAKIQGAKIKKAHLNKYPNADWEVGDNVQLSEEVFGSPVDTNAMVQIVQQAVAKLDGENAQEIEKLLMEGSADVLKARGWGSHGIKRQGIEGYEKQDIIKVLYDYKSGLNGWLTKMDAAKDFAEALDTINAKDTPELWEYSKQYVNDMLRNSDKIDRTVGNIKAVAFMWYLGGNIKTAMVNLTQNIVVGAPRLGMDVAGSTLRWLDASRDALTSQVTGGKGLNDEESRLIQELYGESVITDAYMEEVRGSIGGNSAGAQMWNKAMKIMGLPMSSVEKFNRASLALAAFRAAKVGALKPHARTKYGVGKDGKADYEQAKAFAAEIVKDSHFVYGKSNLPSAFRSSKAGRIVSSMYTFRTFSHNMLNMWSWALKTQGKDGKVFFMKSIGATMALGGLTAFPFYATLTALGQALSDSDEEWTEVLRNSLWEDDLLRDVVCYGVPSLAGVNLGGSLKMETPLTSGVSKGTTPQEVLTNSIGDILGIPYDLMIVKPSKIIEARRHGNDWRMVEAVLPVALKNGMQAWRLYDEGQTTMSGKPINSPATSGARKLSEAEALAKLFGFQPTSSTKSYDAYKSRLFEVDARSSKLDELTVMALKTYDTGKADGRLEAMSEMRKWNEKMDKEGRRHMIISARDIERRVKSRRRENKPTAKTLEAKERQQRVWGI
ncbi:MAG: PLxRFG domain-containing protein [Pseudomonadota bacterium]